MNTLNKDTPLRRAARVERRMENKWGNMQAAPANGRRC